MITSGKTIRLHSEARERKLRAQSNWRLIRAIAAARSNSRSEQTLKSRKGSRQIVRKAEVIFERVGEDAEGTNLSKTRRCTSAGASRGHMHIRRTRDLEWHKVMFHFFKLTKDFEIAINKIGSN